MASHRRFSQRPPQPGGARSTRLTVLSAAALTVAALSGAATTPMAFAEPHVTTADVASRVDRLYEQAEKATEQYNAAKERSETLRDEIDNLRDRAARGQEQVNRLRDGLGTLAGAQYREGAVDPSLSLMLSSDPDSYLGRAEALDRLADRRATEIRELQEAQRSLGQQRSEATAKLSQLEKAGRLLNARKRTVQSKLAEARRLVNTLSPQQRAGFASGGRASRSGAGHDRTIPVLPGLGSSSGRAAMAVAAARQAVGAPYVWGSTGPGAFDCSGLMVWSYGQAGIALPRTSQGQMHAGQRVPLHQARPGDLVIYRGDASHVGMYVGGGQVVHAPYPGARVRYDPVGMMPITSVTRP